MPGSPEPTTNPRTHCVLYARVSTDKQADKELSIPAQLQAMREYARQHDWAVVEEFLEPGASARTAERPELQRLLARCRADDKPDVVLVHKVDRLARNVFDHATIRALLKQRGIRLASVVENVDESVSGELVENIMASIAQFYSGNLSDEVKKGMRQKVLKGGCVLLKPLPWPDAERLVRLEETRGLNHARAPWTITNATYHAWLQRADTVDAIGSWFGPPPARMTLAAAGGEAARLDVTGVTPSLFSGVLRAVPVLGRLFNDGDLVHMGIGGRGDAALLSDGLWQHRFAGDPAIVGQSIRLDGRAYTIVGVMPRDFVFPDARTQLWVPQAVPAVIGTTPKGEQVLRATISQVLARLKPGVSAAQAATEATARAQAAPDLLRAGVALFGANGAIHVRAEPALAVQTADVRPAILMLMAAAMLLFVTGVGSAMGVQLAHATTRRHEIAIRAAIGAASGQLARQWIIETLLVGGLSGIAGLCLAALMQRGLVEWLPADFPRGESIAMHTPVVLFAVGVSLLSSGLCALMPALQARRVNLLELLVADAGTPVSRGTRAGVARTRAVIMAAQVAMACVLLVGAGLLTRAFLDLRHSDRGYDPVDLLTARLPFPSAYAPARRVQLLEGLHVQVRATTGVEQTAFANGLPLVAVGGVLTVDLTLPSGEARSLGTTWSVVSPDYFTAMHMRLVAGRWLQPTDTSDTRPAVVINRAFAASLGTSGLGQPLRGFSLDDKSHWEVVGVVDDVQESATAAGQSLDAVGAAHQPAMYVSYRQVPDQVSNDPFIIVRTHNDPASYISLLRDALRAQDHALVFDSLMTMDDRIDASLATPRLYAVLITVFGVCAMCIALAGLFGLLAYTVANRTKEIGVRTALGATPTDILRLILGQGMIPATCGLLAGMLTAAALAKALSRLLYGVSAHDTLTFVAVPAFLLVTTLTACAIPAIGAARLDPLRALKS